MKLARLHKQTVLEGSDGYAFYGSQREAEKARTAHKRDNKLKDPCSEIDTIEVEPTREGIIKALNRYAGHPDNG